MTQHQDATAAAATVADESGELWRELLGRVAGCFPRRETRQNAADMADGLLMELEDYNCWTIGEALGHAGPHRLQHLLSRAADRDMIATAYTELRRRNLEQMRLTVRQPG